MSLTVPTGILRGYRPISGAFDEMLGADGLVREPWSLVAGAFDDLDAGELALRAQETTRLLDDDGVTYHVVDGPTGAGNRWALDPVPMVIGGDEWARLDAGIVQRADLFNAVLTDLYGPRRLLSDGLLPPELIFGHPGFLRACDQIRIPGATQLFTYAVDLARHGDGTWVALADRTQAPSGAGYALENRVVVSRVLPAMYRDAQVQRLAPFFRSLRAALQAAAPRAVDDPRIVVLTPGPRSETAFEHALLASTLGYPMVEGSDLRVRDGKVWMRTLGRLESVDVILRRVDSWYCDPLELNPESHLGVPGLIEASRLGTVSVVNTLGSAILENTALVALLPRLSRELLGTELLLPSVATWWCGDPEGRRAVLANLENLVLKPVARAASSRSIEGRTLSRPQLTELRHRIEARPEQWVGQETVELATAPSFTGHGLEPRRALLRAFAVARHDSYVTMPGGLTRVAGVEGRPRISNQSGAISKDTWVLVTEPEKLTGYWLHSGPAVTATEPAASMSSRSAEQLYWIGRYAERVEDGVRLLRVVHDRRNEFQHGRHAAGTECLQLLLRALTDVTTTYPGFVGDGAAARIAAPGAELLAVMVDQHRAGSVAHGVRRLVDAAMAVRDQLSLDTWQLVANLDRELLGLDGHVPDAHTVVPATLGRVMQSLLALAGLASESMVRDPGWQFMESGRRIERALQLLTLLESTVTVEHDTATESLVLESVLTAAESIITYRRRYRSQAQLETLLDLLLLDGANPRSLAYQIERLSEALTNLPGHSRNDRLSDERRYALEASTRLRLADTRTMSGADSDGNRPGLAEFLRVMIDLLRRTADALDASHFTHQLPQHTVMSPANSRGGQIMDLS